MVYAAANSFPRNLIKDPKKPVVLILPFENESRLNDALVRPCSHYEGAEMRHGMVGINFPRESFISWQGSLGKSGTMNQQEQQLAQILGSYRNIQYIIAFVEGDESTKRHELAHALFALDSSYEAFVMTLWASLPQQVSSSFHKELSARGYQGDKVIDEWQAYLAESMQSFGKKFQTACVTDIREKLLIKMQSLDNLVSLVEYKFSPPPRDK